MRFLLIFVAILASAQEGGKKNEPTVAELQKQLDDTTKLLQEYYNRYTTCDLSLTQLKVNGTKPKEESNATGK